ncbi:MAG: CsgG/HfaB family protein [Treponema sp.]|jgi:curli biogenesis system outer membrane secretion channel CsgG|nr:CsgG/HfaB family protein [Treponema sp.]
MKNYKFVTTIIVVSAVLMLFLTGCATESSRTVAGTETQASRRVYTGPRSPIVVGRFENRSDFMRGIFSDGEDRLGGQAKTILVSHLNLTNRFTVLDRDNMEQALREAQIRGTTQQLQGATHIVTGDVTEFGRREVSDTQLYGILGRGKRQVAYTKVMINIVDIRTSAIVYTVQGAGEYVLDSREIAGFGTSAGYDSTLNGKVLDLAIREAVDRLSEAIDAGAVNLAGR